MFIPLLAPRLVLRAFTLEDVETFHAYRADPEVARYQGWSVPYTQQQALQSLTTTLSQPAGTPGHWCQIALELRETGEHVGDCAFCIHRTATPDEPHQADIGFTLARAHQGKGYATEAVTRLLAYLFQEQQVHRVRASCDVLNPASARVMERAGMRREGHFLEAVWFKGEWSSEYLYALLRREWEARQPREE